MLVQTIQGSHIQKDIKMKISFPEMETHFNNLQRMFGLLNYQRDLPFCKTHVRRSAVHCFTIEHSIAHSNVRRGNTTDFSVKQME